MARGIIRWEQIQNLKITEAEINNLHGITASATEINILDGYTGTTGDLNNAAASGAAIAAHTVTPLVGLSGAPAHQLINNTFPGAIIKDGTIRAKDSTTTTEKSKLFFDGSLAGNPIVVADSSDIAKIYDKLNSQVGSITPRAADIGSLQTQIDNLWSVVIPGQGSDIGNIIVTLSQHISDPLDAHDASAISYGDSYDKPITLVADTVAGRREVLMPILSLPLDQLYKVET